MTIAYRTYTRSEFSLIRQKISTLKYQLKSLNREKTEMDRVNTKAKARDTQLNALAKKQSKIDKEEAITPRAKEQYGIDMHARDAKSIDQ